MPKWFLHSQALSQLILVWPALGLVSFCNGLSWLVCFWLLLLRGLLCLGLCLHLGFVFAWFWSVASLGWIFVVLFGFLWSSFFLGFVVGLALASACWSYASIHPLVQSQAPAPCGS